MHSASPESAASAVVPARTSRRRLLRRRCSLVVEEAAAVLDTRELVAAWSAPEFGLRPALRLVDGVQVAVEAGIDVGAFVGVVIPRLRVASFQKGRSASYARFERPRWLVLPGHGVRRDVAIQAQAGVVPRRVLAGRINLSFAMVQPHQVPCVGIVDHGQTRDDVVAVDEPPAPHCRQLVKKAREREVAHPWGSECEDMNVYAFRHQREPCQPPRQDGRERPAKRVPREIDLGVRLSDGDVREHRLQLEGDAPSVICFVEALMDTWPFRALGIVGARLEARQIRAQVGGAAGATERHDNALQARVMQHQCVGVDSLSHVLDRMDVVQVVGRLDSDKREHAIHHVVDDRVLAEAAHEATHALPLA
mmetsp:Transcript_12559/g.52828  ORF Transcript_12559/g.52828 Transcript_12559/m.52828 type:complete len:364 (-) Transcript_12559:653-1744(-)